MASARMRTICFMVPSAAALGVADRPASTGPCQGRKGAHSRARWLTPARVHVGHLAGGRRARGTAGTTAAVLARSVAWPKTRRGVGQVRCFDPAASASVSGQRAGPCSRPGPWPCRFVLLSLLNLRLPDRTRRIKTARQRGSGLFREIGQAGRSQLVGENREVSGRFVPTPTGLPPGSGRCP
jgi:hypothetical protein